MKEKMMSGGKIKLIVFIIIVCLATISCTTTRKTFPVIYTHSTSSEFEILGTIFIRNSNYVGYNTVFEEAKKQFPLTDYVIDIMIDEHEITTSYNIFVYFFKLMFGNLFGTMENVKTETVKYEYTIRGTAIQYIRRNTDGERITTPTPSSSAQNTRNSISSVVETVIPNRTAPAPAAPEVPKVNDQESYTVVNVTGLVQVAKFSGDNWSNVKTGDILNRDFRIRTGINSELILSDKDGSITIPGGVEGRINSLIGMVKR